MCKEIYQESVQGICPYCLKNISIVWVCKVESIIGIRYVYFCGECQKKLGMSSEKALNLSSSNTVITTGSRTANHIS